jgi:hypothetical protein
MNIQNSNQSKKKKKKKKKEKNFQSKLSKPKNLSPHKHEKREYEGLEIIP